MSQNAQHIICSISLRQLDNAPNELHIQRVLNAY